MLTVKQIEAAKPKEKPYRLLDGNGLYLYVPVTDRRIQMDAQTRRRERRAEKQAQWKAANPLLVGVSAKPVNRPILSLNRKPKSRVESALNPIDLTVLAEYHEQIESNLQRIERKNQRTWYSKPRSEMGVTCVGSQKMKLGSKPLI